MLRRFADTVAAHIDELAELEASNVGKPIGGAQWEAGAVADVLHYYAGAVDKHTGTTLPWGDGLAMTLHEPLGVVGLITPWNFPMLIASWKLGPALACGNTVVLKPSELTPLTSLRLAELALEAGIPEGVFNVVVGDGATAGQRLVDHPDVAKIGFTGSTAVGKHIMRCAADTLKRVTLELGGKSANIVFADADLEAAAAGVPGSVFDNAGQDCCARSRILVERSVHDRFVELVADVAAGVHVGRPHDPDAFMGPLISAAHRSKVASFEGEGTIAFQGDVPDGPGFWYPPTVVTGCVGAEPRRQRRDLRTGRDGPPVRRRGRRRPAGQRDAVRPVGIDLDPRRGPRAAHGPRRAERHAQRELQLVGAVLDAVRRVQAERHRPRPVDAGARALQRDQDRLHGRPVGSTKGERCRTLADWPED